MKKIILQKLYNICLSLSYHFDNKLLAKCTIFLGTSLLMLISSCNADSKTEEPEVTCYVSVAEEPPAQDTTSSEDPEAIYCYAPMIVDEPTEKQSDTEKSEPESSSTDAATETTENQ